MKYDDFKEVIDTLEEKELEKSNAYNCGIDIADHDVGYINAISTLFQYVYPDTYKNIEFYCWDLCFGLYWKPGLVEWRGRPVFLNNPRSLWLLCEGQPVFEDKF